VVECEERGRCEFCFREGARGARKRGGERAKCENAKCDKISRGREGVRVRQCFQRCKGARRSERDRGARVRTEN